ncbi:COG complex component [Hysterangium stoloniferum]|nr:COG complex component [Hysterangium stoloniferum]
MSQSLPNGEQTNQQRISTLLADHSGDDYVSDPHTDLPNLTSLSHNDPHLAASSFSAEDFLVSRSLTSLPDLRVELRDYQATLKEELVQLINDDYAAFISLSTDLRGEGVRLERLKYPLNGLKQEIQTSLDQLKLIQTTVQDKLDERSALREEKALLHLLLKLSESLARLESLLLIAPQQDEAPGSPVSNSSLNTTTQVLHGDDERTRMNRVKHLARVASEFNQLLYHVEKARTENCAFVGEINWRVNRVKTTLSSDLDHLFATTLLSLTSSDHIPKSTHSEPDKARWWSDLKECLRIYDSLGGWRDAEEVIRRELVKGFVKQTIFAGSLSVPHSPLMPHTPFLPHSKSGVQSNPSTPYTPFSYTARLRKTPFEPQFLSVSEFHLPLLDDSEDDLATLYNKILRFVERDLKRLMEVAEQFTARHHQHVSPQPAHVHGDAQTEKPSQNGFDIMSRVVWAEIGRAIMEELGSVVFAAGNPDDFRLHYASTQNFLAALEFLSPSLQSVQLMRSHPTYLAFQRRWQLPIYFQLRWKDIVGKLEEALALKLERTSISAPAFITSQAAACYEALCMCWSAEICIPEIGYRFWRLTLQILSRYRTWLLANQPPREPSANVIAAIAAEKAGNGPGTSNQSTRSSTPIPHSEQSTETTAADDSLLNRCGTLIFDIKQMQKKVLELWNVEISVILPDVAKDDEASPSAALQHSLANLEDLIPALASHIVAILTRRSCEALAPVRSIPSQYRAMSNKRIPVEASHFVPEILKPVTHFLRSIPDILVRDLGTAWATEIFGAVCSRYMAYLTAMKKTEESLRRLKKGKISAFSIFGGGSATVNKEQESKDEERVRVQMVLDVAALGRDARSLGVDVDSHIGFRELETMATQAPAEGSSTQRIVICFMHG